jgi:hypothetical protein
MEAHGEGMLLLQMFDQPSQFLPADRNQPGSLFALPEALSICALFLSGLRKNCVLRPTGDLTKVSSDAHIPSRLKQYMRRYQW